MDYIIPIIIITSIFVGSAILSFLVIIDQELKKGNSIKETLDLISGKEQVSHEVKFQKYKPQKGYISWQEVNKEKVEPIFGKEEM